MCYCADEEEVEVWIVKELTPSTKGGEKGSVLTLLVLLLPELLTWLWVLVNLVDDPRSFERKSDLTGLLPAQLSPWCGGRKLWLWSQTGPSLNCSLPTTGPVTEAGGLVSLGPSFLI